MNFAKGEPAGGLMGVWDDLMFQWGFYTLIGNWRVALAVLVFFLILGFTLGHRRRH